ncbi:MAG: hypothetical protein R3E10_02760 [Gemmatimonadota bacterium]
MKRRARAAHWVCLLAGLVGAASLGGCGSDAVGADPSLQGGILVTFAVGSERFRVWIVNPATIDDVFDLQTGASLANIPNAAIRTGAGDGAHNAPWSWHLDAQDVEMADATIEVCDGSPSYVEEHLQDYLQIGRYCPWGARLVAVDDRR